MPILTEAKAIPGTTDARAPIRKVLVWKGEHHSCELGHADGVCRSLKAWRLDADCRPGPVIVGRSIERRHQVMAEFPDESGLEPMPAWQAKGFRVASEAARAKPAPEIVAKMREDGAEGVVRELQHQKAPFADQQSARKAFLEKFDAANFPKKGRSDG